MLKRRLSIFASAAIAAFLIGIFLTQNTSAASLTTLDVPVEITWNELSDDARPESINVYLYDTSTTPNTIFRQLTLSAADADPNDATKWLGTFENVPYVSNLSINYALAEDNPVGYDTVIQSAGYNIDAQLASTSSTLRSGIIFREREYTRTVPLNNRDDVFWFTNGNTAYVWSKEAYTGDDFAKLRSLLNLGSSINNIEYFTGENAVLEGVDGSTTGRATIRLDNGSYYADLYLKTTTWFRGMQFYFASISAPYNQTPVRFQNTQQRFTLTLRHRYESSPSTSFAVNETYTLGYGQTYTVNPVERGYYFGYLADGQSETGVMTGNLTLTYLYTIARHKVIYEFEGDIPEGGEALLPAEAEYDAGTTVSVAATIPDQGDYLFLGWSHSGSVQVINEDIVIKGRWIKWSDPPPVTGAQAPNLSSYLLLITLSLICGGVLIIR